jgi:N-acylneuraminate cytidylyltransferase
MNTFQNNLCIIPARGGSKRIPKKNIKNFLGKPIIAYSIEAALNSNLFKEVMVSTDDVEIAELAISLGAHVPFLRSNVNSDDFATTLDVLQEVYAKYKEMGAEFDTICCIYPTAPFVSSFKLIDSFSIFNREGFDSLLPVLSFSFPIQRSFEKFPNGKIQYKFEEFKNTRSQDLQESFHDAGQFYWLRKNILESSSMITQNTGAIVISELEGQDIDNETDWKLAEMKYELLQSIN